MSYVKKPGETKDYTITWAAEMAAHGDDTITASAWTVQTGLTSEDETNTTTTTTVWLSGGTADQDYEVTNTVTTAGGRILVSSFEVLVRNS